MHWHCLRAGIRSLDGPEPVLLSRYTPSGDVPYPAPAVTPDPGVCPRHLHDLFVEVDSDRRSEFYAGVPELFEQRVAECLPGHDPDGAGGAGDRLPDGVHRRAQIVEVVGEHAAFPQCRGEPGEVVRPLPVVGVGQPARPAERPDRLVEITVVARPQEAADQRRAEVAQHGGVAVVGFGREDLDGPSRTAGSSSSIARRSNRVPSAFSSITSCRDCGTRSGRVGCSAA